MSSVLLHTESSTESPALFLRFEALGIVIDTSIFLKNGSVTNVFTKCVNFPSFLPSQMEPSADKHANVVVTPPLSTLTTVGGINEAEAGLPPWACQLGGSGGLLESQRPAG